MTVNFTKFISLFLFTSVLFALCSCTKKADNQTTSSGSESSAFIENSSLYDISSDGIGVDSSDTTGTNASVGAVSSKTSESKSTSTDSSSSKSGTSISSSASEPPGGKTVKNISFKGKSLSVPAVEYKPEMDQGSVKALMYSGMPYEGKSTKIFAYIGYPASASSTKKAPAVVLIHGGGGTAFADWVRLWNAAGYIAIAMDTEGHLPGSTDTYSWSGPANVNFGDIDKPITDQWMYHAVASSYLAYLLLANDSSVDSTKIGIVGISWGGVAASVAIGNANNFAFAVPIYGCGYLNECKTWMGPLNTAKVMQTWDASNWLGSSKTPTLWLNGDHDTSFSAMCTSKSAALTKNGTIRFIPGLQHGHAEGWAVSDTYAFADSIVQNGAKFVTITQHPQKGSPTLKMTLPSGVKVASAQLRYTTDDYTLGNWSAKTLYASGDTITVAFPASAQYYYVLIKDNNGNTVCSQLVSLK